ncbi:MAG: gamma-glutamyl-gamma-aminobutyrate hydrolase [Sphingomonas sp.]|nr:MAG: gamma-glutamyl-gamma-aminobutyrate hydrolase [Sphingomonas sp.]
MSARPVIGISCCTRIVGGEAAQSVIDRYLEAVVRYADCAALLVPARPDLMRADEVADRLDGLLLTGSPSNVEPARYGDPDSSAGPFDLGRDGMSLALIDAMIARGRPLLGICRGFQELNVAFGGSLARDLGHEGRALSHHSPPDVTLAEMFGHSHEVALAHGGVLAEVLGQDRLRVSSVHYQGIDRLGAGLSVEATAPDGVVEAVSATRNGAPVLAVQWHPEWQTGDDEAAIRLFRHFGRLVRDKVGAPRQAEDRKQESDAS